jgi:hypothetical protein
LWGDCDFGFGADCYFGYGHVVMMMCFGDRLVGSWRPFYNPLEFKRGLCLYSFIDKYCECFCVGEQLGVCIVRNLAGAEQKHWKHF